MNFLKNLFKLDYNPNRIYGLDILRSIAILSVVINHGNILAPGFHIDSTDGVSIFFVLSGFLIGRILIKLIENKEKKNILLNFWIRRWFRTIPNYFLILTLLLIITKEYTHFSYKFPLNYYTFTQNLFYSHPSFFPEVWSISVEEWFYLSVPLIIVSFIFFFKYNPKKAFIITALSILVLSTAIRYYRWKSGQIDSIEQYDLLIRRQVITRLDSLMFGMIGAFIQYYYNGFWTKYKKLFLFLGLFLFYIFMSMPGRYGTALQLFKSLYGCVFEFLFFSIIILLTLPYLSNFKKGKGIFHYFFTYISLISYSLYLIHHTLVRDYIIRLGLYSYFPDVHQPVIDYAFYALYWILSITLSLLNYKYFEVPIMNLRDNKKVKNWISLKEKKLPF